MSNNYYNNKKNKPGSRCPNKGVKGNQVKILNGPATVTGEHFTCRHCRSLSGGKAQVSSEDPEVRKPACLLIYHSPSRKGDGRSRRFLKIPG